MQPGKSGRLVVDLDEHDLRHSGDESFARFCEKHEPGGDWPVTFTVRTWRPEGGAHLWFADPVGHKSRKWRDFGIDVIADVGYVLAPPSIVEGRPYTVMYDDPVSRVRSWIVRELVEAMPAPGGKTRRFKADAATARKQVLRYKRMPKVRLRRQLSEWLTELEEAPESERTPTLFTTALRLSPVIKAEKISQEWAFDKLYEACLANGYFSKYPESEFDRHVSRALYQYAGVTEVPE
jgi:hypothetical protein